MQNAIPVLIVLSLATATLTEQTSARAANPDDSVENSVPVPKRATIRFRPTKAEKQVPERFRLSEHQFESDANYSRSSGPVRVYRVRFPSAVKTTAVANNTVYGDYFQPQGRGPFPGVVVLHILGGEFSMSRMIANGLARRGIAALFIKLPYYGERRQGTRRRLISLDPNQTLESFTQAVLDIRRAAAWLGQRSEVDAERLGITGISLGGIMSALAGPLEPRFRKVAIYLGGGNLGEMIWSHKNAAAAAFRRSWRAKGETRASFLRIVKPIDPVTYGRLLQERQVLIVAAKHDKIVPPQATLALWNASGRKPRLVWLDCGHISAAQFLFGEMQRLIKFFSAAAKK